jgi:hypothetical protein
MDAVLNEISIILSNFKKNLNLSTNCNKNSKYEILWKSVKRKGRCSVRIDGRALRRNQLLFAFRTRQKRDEQVNKMEGKQATPFILSVQNNSAHYCKEALSQISGSMTRKTATNELWYSFPF